METGQRYLRIGIEPTLAGLNHLTSVLGICLIANGWCLVTLLSTLTSGHSLTLAATSLGRIHIPVPPTEAVIALSVAFNAREPLLASPKNGQGFVLVMLFGLLHSLGFASAVSELQLYRESLLPALLAFNLGVELGQLQFVGFFVMTATAINLVGLLDRREVRAPLGLVLGSIAMFWTFERISGFL